MIRPIGERAWALETQNTTYAFRVMETGHLEHLYYGRRLPLEREADLEPLVEKRAFEPGNVVAYSPDHKDVVLEDTCLELSGPGKGDIREPMVEIVHADGSRTCDFLFSEAVRWTEKPELEGLPGSYAESGEAEGLTLRLTEAHSGLALELTYTVWADCDCICRSARLLNESGETVTVERLLSLQLDLCDSPWAVTTFHGAWVREMGKHTVTLTGGKLVSESRAGSSSSRSNPFFMVHAPAATEDAGEVYGFNLLYSGNHYEAVEVGTFGKTRVVTGVHPQGFSWRLGPGETFQAPEAVMTYSHEGFTGQSRNMHAFVREHVVRGGWKKKPRPVLLNSWEAAYFKISETSLVSLARSAKEVGVELFVMDDGWFGERNDDSHGLGDWDPNLKKLPGGLKGICDKVNALGLQFGLWVEPEMVNVQSRLYETHPEWVMELPGRDHSEGRNQRVLDLANPAVVDHLIDKMTGVFSAANIAYVKWDYNRIFSDVFSPALPPEGQGEVYHRYILGLYRLMGTLARRFPDILFEGCASGGNRFDLGILSCFPQIWASDNTDALSRIRIQEGYSYGYPQSVVAAHVSGCPNHQTLRDTPLETRFHVAAFGALGYELDLRDLSGDEKKELKEQIDLYKQWREVFQFGRFYRGRSGELHDWTVVSPDGERAVGMLLQELVEPDTQFHRYFAKGLREEAAYRFHSEPRSVDVREFGSLVNTMAPIHVKQGSLVHHAIARVVKMPGEKEDLTASGATLMYAGVKLKQAFSGTGYSDQVRHFPDFASRMYFMEPPGETPSNEE